MDVLGNKRVHCTHAKKETRKCQQFKLNGPLYILNETHGLGCVLKEFGGLLTENIESKNTGDPEQRYEHQPIPPRLVRVGVNVRDQVVASIVGFWITRIAIVEFFHQENANGVGQGTKVTSPAQPDSCSINMRNEFVL